jgi:hypothetical protein
MRQTIPGWPEKRFMETVSAASSAWKARSLRATSMWLSGDSRKSTGLYF